MEFDPHTLQIILQRIYQQMRCPQCGKKVPVDLSAVRVLSEEAMLLQLRCDDCNAYIVLQASLNGVDSLGAPPYQQNETANASTELKMSETDLQQIREGLTQAGGAFSQYFGKTRNRANGKNSKL